MFAHNKRIKLLKTFVELKSTILIFQNNVRILDINSKMMVALLVPSNTQTESNLIFCVFKRFGR